MSIEERFPPKLTQFIFCLRAQFYTCILMCTNIIYAICPKVIHPLISSASHTSHAHPHTHPHTPTSHPVTFTHNSLTYSQTPPHTHTESPPLHHLPSAQNGYLENGFFLLLLLLLLLLQKLTQSMHLDNKLN